ncbi:MAG: hypothetical protein BSOLF_2758 [Candidatus Carbobacillus altaicus]|uniref:Uncharacterized protein n=1 Tax=Candidatus Carbonibacillus altaicus TaxID=2163959 RepID=A0A2R6Y1Z4_9BACL|nr:MAG: hypothetical protein BSOLF_2758 [Candidatus Carbobacillus altaicus]
MATKKPVTLSVFASGSRFGIYLYVLVMYLHVYDFLNQRLRIVSYSQKK